MKLPHSPSSSIPTSGKNTFHKLFSRVRNAVMALGIFSATAIAEESNTDSSGNTIPSLAERLEFAEEMNKGMLRDNSELQDTIEKTWSQLKDMPGAPKEILDKYGNITPEALQWISETLPKEHISLATELVKAQEKLNKLPKDSIGRPEQLAIVFVSLTLILTFIIYGKGKFKNKKELEDFYEYCREATGEKDVEKIRVFFEKTVTADQAESGDEEDSPSEVKKDLTEDLMGLVSRLRALPEKSVCILTPTKGEPWYIHAIGRTETPQGTVWNIKTKNKEYTMRVTAEGEIELEHNGAGDKPETYATPPLNIFESLEIIDLGHNEPPQLFDDRRINNPIGINEWYLTQFDLSESTLTAGERFLVSTYSGAVYILEVQTDKTFKVLPETPSGSDKLSANTILQGFDTKGGLLRKDGAVSTSTVMSMLRLDAPVSAPEEAVAATAYKPPSQDEIEAMEYPELVRQNDILIQHARQRQLDEAPPAELAGYRERIELFGRQILLKRPKPDYELVPEWAQDTFLADPSFTEINTHLVTDFSSDSPSPEAQELQTSIEELGITTGNNQDKAGRLNIMSEKFISYARHSRLSEESIEALLRALEKSFKGKVLSFKRAPTVGEEFDTSEMVLIGETKAIQLKVTKVLSLAVEFEHRVYKKAKVNC